MSKAQIQKSQGPNSVLAPLLRTISCDLRGNKFNFHSRQDSQKSSFMKFKVFEVTFGIDRIHFRPLSSKTYPHLIASKWQNLNLLSVCQVNPQLFPAITKIYAKLPQLCDKPTLVSLLWKINEFPNMSCRNMPSWVACHAEPTFTAELWLLLLLASLYC